MSDILSEEEREYIVSGIDEARKEIIRLSENNAAMRSELAAKDALLESLNPFPDEKCEGGCSAPVVIHDSEVVPLCMECYVSLLKEMLAAKDAEIEVFIRKCILWQKELYMRGTSLTEIRVLRDRIGTKAKNDIEELNELVEREFKG